ncbi:MAG: hypothetical protein M3N95_01750 [Actinomycetota bacterium]|nr:hypothetical protein [Actinomycetota bacterium]
MTDPTSEDPTAPVREPTDPARPRPTPSAQAASRARRIGGRPMPGPRNDLPATRTDASAGDAGASAGAARTVTEPAPAAAPAGLPTRPTRQPLDADALRRRISRLGWIIAAVSGLAAVALLVVGLWLTDGVWWAKSSTSALREQVRQQVLAAAKTCTAAILSYDYRTLDQNEKAGQACATGQLKADYTKLMDATVKKIAPQSKAVQVMQVAKAAITSVSPDGKQWVVLVYGQESVTTSKVTSPRLDISSASVTLNNVGGVWLVSNMTTTA